MDNLIEALTILKQYIERDSYEWKYPTNCEHDVLHVAGNPANMKAEDVARLSELGFDPNEDTGEGFYSFHYGSA